MPQTCWYCGIRVPGPMSACTTHYNEIRDEYDELIEQVHASVFSKLDTLIEGVTMAYHPKPRRKCLLCPRKYLAIGYCKYHYHRLYKGRPLLDSSGCAILPYDSNKGAHLSAV